MKKTSAARFIVFVVIHVLLCVSAALYVSEYTTLILLESPDSMYIDGADFTPLAELAVISVNGFLSAFVTVICFAFMTILSVVLLIPFRLISVRKFTIITRREQRATLAVILAGTVLTALAVLIFCGVTSVPRLLLFLLPSLLIEILMYWLTLYFRSKR
ncbi:MAG: hypothetical protein ACI4RK_03290 [Oscillospiraceae bacterium]